MQTFLPYASFAESAAALDRRRLGNQRNEALVILRACRNPGYGWQHHPAVNQWRGYEPALIAYGLAVCDEWVARGNADSVRGQLLELAGPEGPRTQEELAASDALPPWLGIEEFHRSHRSALLRKDPEWYGRRFDGVPDDLPYWWPSHHRD